MDPQSVAFTPRTDPWGLQTEMSRVSQIQQEHGERLLRLEKRQEDEARMKSVWGTSSPFPGILSGTPQHGKFTFTGERDVKHETKWLRVRSNSPTTSRRFQ